MKLQPGRSDSTRSITCAALSQIAAPYQTSSTTASTVSTGPTRNHAVDSALLADRLPADLDETPDTGLPPEWERALSSPFVVHERYGTRCSTVLLVEHDGRTTMCERRFDESGNTTGATRLEFASVDVPERWLDSGHDPVPLTDALHGQFDRSQE